jgi:large subunit ribosomal protein L4
MPPKKIEKNNITESIKSVNQDLEVKLVSSDGSITLEKGFSGLIDFDVKIKLLAQVVKAELSNLRTSGAHTKTRDEVRGGGKKPWKQKGTGRARHGSIRSPIWVGGGVTHGPTKNINWHQIITKSMRISALKSIFKDRLLEQNVYQLSDDLDFQKTKQAEEFLTKLMPENKIKRQVLIYTTSEKPSILGFANLDLRKINAEKLKINQLVASQNFILTPRAREVIEARLSK